MGEGGDSGVDVRPVIEKRGKERKKVIELEKHLKLYLFHVINDLCDVLIF